jgi:hypothetical protein
MNAAIIIPIVLIVVMTVSLGISAGYSLLQAKIMPIIVCAVIILLSLVELVGALRNRKNASEKPQRTMSSDADEEEVDRDVSVRSYVVEIGWMAAFFATIYVFGFILAIALFTAIYVGARKTRWVVAVGLGLLMSLLSYVLFAYLVDSELYPGLIPRLLGLAG